ncbi:MAG TPA: DUF1549 domain-containing protein, partial [Armatimonadota bacterium]|nr:DUF1549 domain-containing protein [Armatimonadota bacterium]
MLKKPIYLAPAAFLLLLPLVTAAAAGPSPANGAPAPKSTPDSATQVRLLLEKRCIACHGPDHQQGGLRLDLREEALKGGTSGAAIVPAKGAESLLHRLVAGKEPRRVMPPTGPRLTAAQVALVRGWIDSGAPWPAKNATTSIRPKSDHWAFQPIRRPPLAKVKDTRWGRNGIDSFVLARLEREGLRPAPEADRVTLIRRATLDLTGLPPSVSEVDRFLADRNAEAYEKVVDRLLASPAYGEHWGRRWLDYARYSDTNGYYTDAVRSIWKYRDWVIDAFNRDLPFDQFTVEQMAGDMLPNATVEQKIATGFHRNTMFNEEGGVDREQFRWESVIDRTNTT